MALVANSSTFGPLTVSAVANLAEAVCGDVVAPSINARGHATMLVVEPELLDRAPCSLPAGAQFVEFDGTTIVHAVELDGALPALPEVCSLAGGGVLVVGSCCLNTPEGKAEKNARVYDEHGRLRGAFAAGDGISHVGVDDAGRIWVAYSDEGVYGDPGCIGASGLVRFNVEGEITWSYRPPDEESWIDDCYALNIAGTEVWACYFSSFPIARVRDDAVTLWPNCDHVTAAKALAVDGDHVLLAGGYREEAERAVLLKLDSTGAHEVGRFWLTTPDGASLSGARMIGSGGSVHLFAGTSWYRIDIADLP